MIFGNIQIGVSYLMGCANIFTIYQWENKCYLRMKVCIVIQIMMGIMWGIMLQYAGKEWRDG